MPNTETLDVLLPRLPTPLARVANRLRTEVSRGDGNSRGVFEASQFCVEAYIKYSCLVLVAGVRQREPGTAYRIEHDLANADGLGVWVSGFGHAVAAMWKSPEEAWRQNWRVALASFRPARVPDWLGEAASCARSILEQIRTIENLDEVRSLLGLLQHFVYIRNKTAHGAKTNTFFRATFRSMQRMAELLLSNSPHVFSGLYADCGPNAAGRDALHLEGAAPGTIIPVRAEEWPELYGEPASAVLEARDAGVTTYLPLAKLLHIDTDSRKCLFANSAPQPNQQHEYLDYLDGETRTFPLAEYSVPPGAEPPASLTIVGFPAAHISEIDVAYPVIGSQRHRPRLVREKRLNELRLQWMQVDFTEANAIRVPADSGIYCFVSEAKVAGLPCHNVILYVGRTDNLQERYAQYLRERIGGAGGRKLVQEALVEFPQVAFWYARVPDQDALKTLEDVMIKALDPVANTVGRLGVVPGDLEPIWR